MTKLYVQLGRYGDCMSILPLLYRDSQTGTKPSLMVSKEYAGILEGIGYVEPVIFDGPHTDLGKAVALAKTMSKEVVVTQINGPPGVVQEATYNAGPKGRATSYEKEAWRLAGRLKEWDDCLPLVFDRRDKAREERLLREHDLIKRGKQKPLMLLSLKGLSSPFPHADLLRELVTAKFGNDWRILELPQSERIYDLLAIYERASLLIAVDSAPLHLAWACRKLPVFALTQDKPNLWHGSAWRPNHLWYCRYGDWADRAVEMVEEITNRLPGQWEKAVESAGITVYSEYEHKHSWHGYDSFPIQPGMCARDSANQLKDSKRSPFLRDVLRMAIQKSDDNMPIILTRPQIEPERMSHDVPATWYHVPPFFAYRMADGQFRPVVDLFCATRAQWKAMLPEIPDFVLNGDYYWSQGLWAIFKKHGASDATGCCSFVKEEK